LRNIQQKYKSLLHKKNKSETPKNFEQNLHFFYPYFLPKFVQNTKNTPTYHAMYEQDMMLRFAEITAKVLLKILGLKEAGKFAEAQAEIQQTGKTYFGLSVAEIALISKENIWDFLQNGQKMDLQRIDAFADLLKGHADILVAEGKESESFAYYEKALLLWEGVSKADVKVFSFDRFYKIKALKEKLI